MDKESSAGVQSEALSHIEEREKLVIEARKFNLMSHVFMRVALRDKKSLPICTSDSDRNPRFSRKSSPHGIACFENHITRRCSGRSGGRRKR